MQLILEKECKKLNYRPRQVQIDAVNWLESVWNNDIICKVLSSPVGSGKSLVAKTVAEYNNKEGKVTAIITPQNLLVDQYAEEFKDLNFFKGKANYHCHTTQTTCEEGIELEKVVKKECDSCPYKNSRNRCYNENTTIFNPMSYFVLPKLRESNFHFEVLYEVDTIIIDEVQSLPSILRELSTIKLWSHDISWKSGISSSIPNVIDLIKKYNERLTYYLLSMNMDKKEKVRLLSAQKKNDFICEQLIKHHDFFICEERTEKYRGLLTDCLFIRPKYIPPTIYKNFFKLAKKVILMSGTIFPHIWEELGFDKVDFIDLPSPIPKERRLIFSTSTINISAKIVDPFEREEMLANLASQIRYIVDILHSDESGVVLLPYNLASEIKRFLDDEHYIHMEKKTKKSKIKKFKENLNRRVGIFSGSYEGISLNDDISRFTIIPKVTFPDLMDVVVKVRRNENPLTYDLETMTTLIQASGRSTRSEKDYSVIYILDKNFERVYSRTRRLLPKYFRESLIFSLPTEEHINQFNNFKERE